MKLFQKLRAAKRLSAYAKTRQHSCFIPYADLTQFDTRFEYGGEIFDEFPEIDTPIGGEKEKDFASLKAKFNVNEFHIKPVLCDFLLAEHERIGFF